MSLRIVMMGTGHFALPTFLGLYETSHQVVGLWTQPDRVGKGHHHHRNPLKVLAEEKGTPVFQPEKANRPEALEALRNLRPDVCVVAAYGQILSQKLLDIPRLGMINLHASILPRHRGASPVQYAIWSGDTETGVTIFQIQPKLDAGPILGVVRTEIDPKWTSGDLELQLAQLSVPLAVRVLDKLDAGLVEGEPQENQFATYAPRLKKEDGWINWAKTPREIRCQMHAMQPWPKPYTYLENPAGDPTRLLIFEIQPAELPEGTTLPEHAAPGTVLFADRKRVIVQTAAEPAELITVQPEGKRAMQVSEFLNGHQLHPGDRFLPPPEPVPSETK